MISQVVQMKQSDSSDLTMTKNACTIEGNGLAAFHRLK